MHSRPTARRAAAVVATALVVLCACSGGVDERADTITGYLEVAFPSGCLLIDQVPTYIPEPMLRMKSAGSIRTWENLEFRTFRARHDITVTGERHPPGEALRPNGMPVTGACYDDADEIIVVDSIVDGLRLP